MFQSVKCLPGKQGYLSSNLQHPYEKSGMAQRGGLSTPHQGQQTETITENTTNQRAEF